MSILSIFRKKTLLATLPDRRVIHLGEQTLIREVADSEKVNVEELAAYLVFFQEYLGFNILDETKMDKYKLSALVKNGSVLLRKRMVVVKKKGNMYLLFSTVSNDELIQEFKNPKN